RRRKHPRDVPARARGRGRSRTRARGDGGAVRLRRRPEWLPRGRARRRLAQTRRAREAARPGGARPPPQAEAGVRPEGPPQPGEEGLALERGPAARAHLLLELARLERCALPEADPPHFA